MMKPLETNGWNSETINPWRGCQPLADALNQESQTETYGCQTNGHNAKHMQMGIGRNVSVPWLSNMSRAARIKE